LTGRAAAVRVVSGIAGWAAAPCMPPPAGPQPASLFQTDAGPSRRQHHLPWSIAVGQLQQPARPRCPTRRMAAQLASCHSQVPPSALKYARLWITSCPPLPAARTARILWPASQGRQAMTSAMLASWRTDRAPVPFSAQYGRSVELRELLHRPGAPWMRRCAALAGRLALAAAAGAGQGACAALGSMRTFHSQQHAAAAAGQVCQRVARPAKYCISSGIRGCVSSVSKEPDAGLALLACVTALRRFF